MLILPIDDITTVYKKLQTVYYFIRVKNGNFKPKILFVIHTIYDWHLSYNNCTIKMTTDIYPFYCAANTCRIIFISSKIMYECRTPESI